MEKLGEPKWLPESRARFKLTRSRCCDGSELSTETQTPSSRVLSLSAPSQEFRIMVIDDYLALQRAVDEQLEHHKQSDAMFEQRKQIEQYLKMRTAIGNVHLQMTDYAEQMLGFHKVPESFKL